MCYTCFLEIDFCRAGNMECVFTIQSAICLLCIRHCHKFNVDNSAKQTYFVNVLETEYFQR